MLKEGGIHDAEVHLVKATARHLLLLDDQGCVTRELVELVNANGEEYRKILSELIEKAYPDILLQVQVAHATQQQLKDAFNRDRTYVLAGEQTQSKIVALFKNLCREAGMISDESEAFQVVSEQITTTSESTSSLDAVPLDLPEDTLMPEPSQSNGLRPSQSDVARVKKLVASFVRLDQLARNANWSEVTQAMWIDYVKMSYDLLGDALIQIERTEQ